MRVIILIFCFLGANAQTYDLILGTPTERDVPIYKSREVKYGIPYLERSTVIEFPPPGQQNFAYIRAIVIKDKDRHAGGYPRIVAGGLGQKYVKIELKSKRDFGFNFMVTIYGRY